MNGMADRQQSAPVYEALREYREKRIVPFDVPGHKQGRGNALLRDFLGAQALAVDVNSMKPLDNLAHPTGVIKEAEELAAEAFGAASAFFMVGGTTASVQAMIMATCRSGDKLILPRNIHRSVTGALILAGVQPVYISPGIHPRLGIPLGMDTAEVVAAMDAHPDAAAVFVNNPTYYGVCSDIKAITEAAHARGMLVLADEAHGTHLYFGEGLPLSAMAAGADLAAVSVHKTGGSLTQSSLLLAAETVSPDYLRVVINLTQTTSASYLLLSSLDIARRNLAVNGKEHFAYVMELADYARREIHALGGYYAFSTEIAGGKDVFDFDLTKLSIHTLDIGLAGVEVYDILRDEYGIQIEFGDIGNILAILSLGDNHYSIERLVSALSEIKRRYQKDKTGMLGHEYIPPVVDLSPREAFYAPARQVRLAEGEGLISAEFIMCYPPGIPILAPGERITGEVLEYIAYAKGKGSLLTGPRDLTLDTIQVVEA